MEKIGNLSIEKNKTDENHQFHIKSGAVAQKLIFEYIVFVRSMICNNKWKSVIINFLVTKLEQIPKLVDYQKKELKEKVDLTKFRMAMASLAILGGHTNVFRIGCRVENINSKSNNEKGTLLEINRLAGTCKIIFDSNRNRIIENFEIKKLRPFSEIDLNFSENEKFLKTILAILKNLLDSGEDLEQMKISITRGKSQKRKIQKWSCATCTFINEKHSEMCSMCSSMRPKMADFEDKNKNGDVVDENSKSQISENRFLFCRLRSSAIKSICKLLSKMGTEAFLDASKGFLPVFVKTAMHSTKLNEYISLEYLEAIQTRILELIFENENSFGKVEKIDDLIPFSPFKNLQAKLPTHIDAEYSKKCNFEKFSKLRRLSASQKTSENAICYCRANQLIPKSLKHFYFEAKIIQISENRDFGVAIGLYVEGAELKGKPGNEFSYSYCASTNQIVHDNKSIHVGDNDLRAKDIIGCGYDIIKKSIYFTKNGEKLNRTFEGANSRYYPFLWIESSNTHIEVNFGHEKFAFDFESTLSPEYLQTLRSKKKGRSAAEQKRREMAESLVEIMGHFPIELCEMALEKENDDMQHAVTWLLDRGWRELEKMGDALLKRTRPSFAAERKNRSDSEESLEEEIVSSHDDSSFSAGFSAAEMYLRGEEELTVPVGLNEEEIVRTLSVNRRRSERENAGEDKCADDCAEVGQ
ncbi:hypothetical protein MHBO_000185, partial [Bonamia ostreae]